MLFSTALMRFRVRTGNSLALLHQAAPPLTTGHNTSRSICPEKGNQDGDPGKHTEGMKSGEKITDEHDSSLLL